MSPSRGDEANDILRSEAVARADLKAPTGAPGAKNAGYTGFTANVRRLAERLESGEWTATGGFFGPESCEARMKTPFSGELMTCALCPARTVSDPTVESGWTLCELDGEQFYICPGHLAGKDATVGEHQKAWEQILLALVAIKAAR